MTVGSFRTYEVHMNITERWKFIWQRKIKK
nr:MAG TPA: hypothetical protein [Siphoviridae sp. ctcBx5]